MSWPMVKLASVADVERSSVQPDAIADGTRYLGLEHIESGGQIIGGDPITSGDVASSKFAFSSEHVLYGKLRPYLAKIALPDFGGVCSTDILPVRPKAKLDRRYLAYFLRQPDMVAKANSLATGANLPRLSPKALEQIEIPLPPLEEQKRIAGILDQADALRRLRARALEKLNTLGQTVFQEMFGDPVTNPKGFKTAILGEIIDFVGGSQPAKSHFKYEDGPGLVRFVQTRDFRTDAYKTFIPKTLAKRPFSENDVIIGRYGPPVFQIFRGLSGTYNVALMKAAPKGNITSDFIYYLLQEAKLHAYVVANSERTAGQSGVNLNLLEKYPAYEPPKELQSAFSQRVQTITQQRKYLEASVAMGESLFLSLQSAAFQGKL